MLLTNCKPYLEKAASPQFPDGSLNAMHQYDAALSGGLKAIKMIDDSSLHDSDLELIECYCYGDVLYEMMQALEASSDPGALARAEDINTRLQQLARSGKYKYKGKLVDSLLTYARLLRRNTLIKEAVQYLQDIFCNWENLYGRLEQTTTMVHLYLTCLADLQILVLRGKGEIDQALRYNDEARTLIKNFFGDVPNESILSLLHTQNLLRASLLCDVGCGPKVAEVSQPMDESDMENSDTRED